MSPRPPVYAAPCLEVSADYYTFLKRTVPFTLQVRAEGDVAIALQLDDDRLQHVFPPGSSLWDVVTYWENRPGLDHHKGRLIKTDNPNLHPVCTYMREEVS